MQAVKDKIAGFTGSQAGTMDLYLGDTPLTVDNSNLDRMLGFFSPASGATIRCIDNNPFSLARNGGLEDVSRAS